MTTAAQHSNGGERRSAGILGAQAPIAAIGLVAIIVIVAISYLSRPQLLATDARLFDTAACGQCGTVVAVRRSAHSVPVYYVEVRMRDGTTLTVRELATGLSVGDVVEVRGTALTPRDIF